MYPATLVTALTMFPERRASAPKTAIVITASTTPYSAIVCPSSRFRREANKSKSFSTCFTSLLRLREGRNESKSCKFEPVSSGLDFLVTPEEPPWDCLGVAAPPACWLCRNPTSPPVRRRRIPRARDSPGRSSFRVRTALASRADMRFVSVAAADVIWRSAPIDRRPTNWSQRNATTEKPLHEQPAEAHAARDRTAGAGRHAGQAQEDPRHPTPTRRQPRVLGPLLRGRGTLRRRRQRCHEHPRVERRNRPLRRVDDNVDRGGSGPGRLGGPRRRGRRLSRAWRWLRRRSGRGHAV